MRRAVYDSEDYREGMSAFMESVNLNSSAINHPGYECKMNG